MAFWIAHVRVCTKVYKPVTNQDNPTNTFTCCEHITGEGQKYIWNPSMSDSIQNSATYKSSNVSKWLSDVNTVTPRNHCIPVHVQTNIAHQQVWIDICLVLGEKLSSACKHTHSYTWLSAHVHTGASMCVCYVFVFWF